jgi:signal transduction histidine kinase
MEDAQILLEKAVRSRTQELELATKEAEESNLLKDKYFTHLTHDLKTPITNVIRSLNRIIKDYNTLDDESKITFINQAKLSSKESLNMIGILLNINQLRTNLTQIKLEEVNLFREVNSAINLHWDYIKSKKIAIHNLLVVDLKVYSDKILIQEVLSNLISNSIKISKSAGKINISTEEQELSLIVMIEVFEVGVDESILGNFPNSEIQTSRTSASGDIGVGLGILLVKDIIQSWKGTLAIDSKIGEGTKFSFTIPKLD